MQLAIASLLSLVGSTIQLSASCLDNSKTGQVKSYVEIGSQNSGTELELIFSPNCLCIDNTSGAVN